MRQASLYRRRRTGAQQARGLAQRQHGKQPAQRRQRRALPRAASAGDRFDWVSVVLSSCSKLTLRASGEDEHDRRWLDWAECHARIGQ